jgi:hypothetical protein
VQVRDVALSKPGLELGEALGRVGEGGRVLGSRRQQQGGVKDQLGQIDAQHVHGVLPSIDSGFRCVFRANLGRAPWQGAGSGSYTASANTRASASFRSWIRPHGHRTFTTSDALIPRSYQARAHAQTRRDIRWRTCQNRAPPFTQDGIAQHDDAKEQTTLQLFVKERVPSLATTNKDA